MSTLPPDESSLDLDLELELDPAAPGAPLAPPDPPLIAYRAALKRYDGARLVEIHAATGGADLGGKAARLPDSIADRLAELRASDRMVAGLPFGARVALGLVALAETTTWPATGDDAQPPLHGGRSWPGDSSAGRGRPDGGQGGRRVRRRA